MAETAEAVKLSDQDILTQALEDFKIADTGEKDIRDEYDRCMRFIALDQYPPTGPASSEQRRQAGLPSLVIDNLGPICDQIINDWIRNRMGIQIAPADAFATESTAKVLSGYVRNLEYLSRARLHYDTGFRNMVRGNRGFVGVLTRRKPGTWKQELVIRGFPDSQCVYLDPFATELDNSDLEYAFVRTLISQKQFKRENPNASETDFADWGADYTDWVKNDGVVVAEYWKARYRPRKLQRLTKKIRIQRGSQLLVTDTVYDDEYRKLPRGVDVATNPEDGGARWEEDEPERIIEFRKITGKEILSTTRWVGSVIPIVEMAAKVVIVDGKKKKFSAISRGLDPQCQLNYAESGIAEELGSTVRVPWVGALGQFKSQRKAWQSANLERFAFLEYDPVMVGDKLAPPPSRDQHEPQIQALAEASDRAQNNIRMTTGINKSNLGIADNKRESGAAVKALQTEGDNATSDFPAAGSAALELIGTIIVDVAPKILTEPEIIQILNDQEKQEAVLINADPKTYPWAPAQQVDAHFLDRGEYKVRVSAAPSAQTLRDQTEDALQQLFQGLPEPQKVLIAAPMVREMTFNGKDEIADRLELPQYAKPKPGQPAISPEAQQVIQQGQQLIQAAQQHIAVLEQERNAKILELQNKKEIAGIQGATQVAVARIAQQTKTGVAAFEAEIEHIRTMLDAISGDLQQQHEAGLQASQQAHEATMQQDAQQHQASLQESQQQATADQAQQAQTTQAQQQSAEGGQ